MRPLKVTAPKFGRTKEHQRIGAGSPLVLLFV